MNVNLTPEKKGITLNLHIYMHTTIYLLMNKKNTIHLPALLKVEPFSK